MADTTDSLVSFYCHRCDRAITPVMPEFTCPRCNGGFVERVEPNPTSQFPPGFEEPGPEDNVGPAFMDALRFMTGITDAGASGSSSASQQSRRQSAPPSGAASSSNLRGDPTRSGSVRTYAFGPGGPNIQIGVRSGEMDFPWLQDFFNVVLGAGWQMDQGGTGGVPILFNVGGGNLGDYAWGPQGLDNIVTQLLNQLEGQGGAPPLSPGEIENITKMKVTEAMRDKSSQCSVCMEDFEVGEDVRRLTCDHFFHDPCIIPWVQRHGTCPVCRKELGTSPRSVQQNGPRVVFGGAGSGAPNTSSPQSNGAGAAGGSAEPRTEGSANQASSNAQGTSNGSRGPATAFDGIWDPDVTLDEPDID